MAAGAQVGKHRPDIIHLPKEYLMSWGVLIKIFQNISFTAHREIWVYTAD